MVNEKATIIIQLYFTNTIIIHLLCEFYTMHVFIEYFYAKIIVHGPLVQGIFLFMIF